MGSVLYMCRTHLYYALEQWDEEVELKQYDRMKRYSDNVETLYGEKPYEKKK